METQKQMREMEEERENLLGRRRRESRGLADVTRRKQKGKKAKREENRFKALLRSPKAEAAPPVHHPGRFRINSPFKIQKTNAVSGVFAMTFLAAWMNMSSHQPTKPTIRCSSTP
jgi:hypothetical protein